MIRIASKLKYKFFSAESSIPPAEKVTPIVYTLAGIFSVFAIVSTILTLTRKQGAHIPSIPVTSTINKNHSVQGLPYIITRNIFNVNGLIPDAESDGQNICPAEPYKSELPYKITGILFGGSSESSLVVLEGGIGSVFKLGDRLPQGGVIDAIEKTRILVISKHCPEFINLIYPTLPNPRLSRSPQNASGASYKEDGFERNGNNTTASKTWINNILTNDFARTLEEAKASPNIVGGQVKGFVITNITQNSVYSKLGLKDGDVVSSINGIELNDAARAIQTLNAMRNENAIELQIIRGGQPISFKVNVQ